MIAITQHKLENNSVKMQSDKDFFFAVVTVFFFGCYELQRQYAINRR